MKINKSDWLTDYKLNSAWGLIDIDWNFPFLVNLSFIVFVIFSINKMSYRVCIRLLFLDCSTLTWTVPRSCCVSVILSDTARLKIPYVAVQFELTFYVPMNLFLYLNLILCYSFFCITAGVLRWWGLFTLLFCGGCGVYRVFTSALWTCRMPSI